MIHQYNLQNQFTLVGIVNEAELYNLYKNSQGVVIPTLYEAGSFPLVESILMEIPVICSNITSLPETIGNQEFIFDPNSVENIAKKIELLWINENYRNLRENYIKLKTNYEELQEKNDTLCQETHLFLINCNDNI